MAVEKDDIVLKTLGLIFRKYRKDRKMTLGHVEVICEIDQAELSKIENGLKNMNITTFIKICHGLGASPAQIFELFEKEYEE